MYLKSAVCVLNNEREEEEHFKMMMTIMCGVLGISIQTKRKIIPGGGTVGSRFTVRHVEKK